MTRQDFTSATQRQAWERSGRRCEAEGAIYGLPSGIRCHSDLILGVEYDHIDPDRNSRDNSLENCAAVCPACHRWKTSNRDRPLLAKTNHQEDMARGVKKPGRTPMPGSKDSGWRKPMNGPAVRR